VSSPPPMNCVQHVIGVDVHKSKDRVTLAPCRLQVYANSAVQRMTATLKVLAFEGLNERCAAADSVAF